MRLKNCGVAILDVGLIDFEGRCSPLLADARAAPMYARLTFTGATGFDVGSEP